MKSLLEVFSEGVENRGMQIALLTEKNQLTNRDLLGLVHLIDINLRTRSVQSGATIVLNSIRPEFAIAMMLVASRRSYRVIFSPVRSVEICELEYDHVLTTEGLPDVDQSKVIVIEPDWFVTLSDVVLENPTRLSGDGAVFVHASSGSTGIPKFFEKSEADVLISVIRPPMPTEPFGKVRFLSTMGAAMGWTLTAVLRTISSGGSALLLQDQSDRLLQYIDLYQVSHITTTPAVARQILDVENAGQYLNAVKDLKISGAFTSAELMAQISEICDARISTGFGMSEIGGVSVRVFSKDMDVSPGYLGDVDLNNIEVVFFDDEMNLDPSLSEGIVGFKRRDDREMAQYTGKNFGTGVGGYQDGYFVPGDVLRLEGKSLHYIGRVKNIINFSGSKISLDLIQGAVDPHIRNGQAACIVQADEMGIEHITLCHTAECEFSIEELNGRLAELARGLTIAKSLVVANIPMTLTGKIKRVELEKMAGEEK